MDKLKVKQLFDEIVEAHSKTVNPPKLPKRVEDLDEYEDYLEHTRVYHEHLVRLTNLRGEFLRIFPPKVWFKHDDVGIGVAIVFNRGGLYSYFEFRVKPWDNKMPSLEYERRK